MPAAPDPSFEPTAPRARVLHGWISADVFKAFEAEARRRRLHPDALAAQLLTLVASDRLFIPLLDN